MLINRQRGSGPPHWRWSGPLVVVAVVLALAAAMAPAAAASTRAPATAAQAASAKLRPDVKQAVAHDTSPPLRSIAPPAPAAKSPPTRELDRLDVPHKTGAAKSGETAKVQSDVVTNSMPDLQQNFEGVGNVNGVLPPDTQGDVGPNHYVQMINLSFAIYDKQGNKLVGPLPNTALWQGMGTPCSTVNGGDPITMYDESADRWFMSNLAYPGGAQGYHQCIAISQTPDPTGAWHRYDFLFSQTTLNDYPKFGIWPDAYYATHNEFLGAASFTGVTVQAYEREKMLNGQDARVVSFHVGDSSGIYGSLLPGDAEGGKLGFNPPSGAPNPFVMFDDDAWGFSPTDRVLMWDFHVDWADTNNSTFGNNGAPNRFFQTAPFDSNLCNYARSCIKQPGTTVGLDTLADRLMNRAAYRNLGDHQGIALTHSVDVGADRAGVRWYQLDNSGAGWNLKDQGTYAPDADSRWMGSAALDASGNLAVGFSVSSTTTFPSLRVAGRLASDPAGQFGQGEKTLIAGGGSQTHSASRWGDYASIQVDPTDGCTFWFTSEYNVTTSSADWHTRIGSFKFPTCTAGPHGDLTGTVADSSTGKPIEGAVVQAAQASTTTDAAGHYRITLPVGTYDVTASAFGYKTKTQTGVTIADGGTTTVDLALDPAPRVTVSGKVTDGSGHGWPLYASIKVDGRPGGSTWTNPATGQYTMQLPADTTYNLTIETSYPGYNGSTKSLQVGSGDQTADFALTVSRCQDARGYQFGAKIALLGDYSGQLGGYLAGMGIPTTAVTWTSNLSGYDLVVVGAPGAPGLATFQQFIANTDAAGTGVVFLDQWYTSGNGIWSLWQYLQNPTSRGTNYNTAIPYTYYKVTQAHPILDGFAVGDQIKFDQTSFYKMHSWFDGYSGDGREVIATAGRSDTGDVGSGIGVQQRANNRHTLLSLNGPSPYINPSNWTQDGRTIFLNALKWVAPGATFGCVLVPGGLVVGNVNDANTGDGIIGAKVTSADRPADQGITVATPDDPAIGDGFYSLFSSLTGSHTFNATKPGYVSAGKSADVVADNAVGADFTLNAGRLAFDPQAVQTSPVLGDTATATVKISNTGNAPAELELAERSGAFQILTMKGAPLQHFRMKVAADPGWLGDHANDERIPGIDAGPPAEPTWSTIAPHPTAIMDNAADVIDGKVYSVGGYNGSTIIADGFVYDPAENSWAEIADMPVARQKPGVAAVNGKLYVSGGWDTAGNPVARTDVYDPASNSWSTVASNPSPAAAPGVAVANGKIYLVGGCSNGSCATTTKVVSYDPATDAWSTNASYPHNNAWQGCGGVDGTVYCAGGTDGSATFRDGFAYDPGSDSWSPIASLPLDLWASAPGAPNGMLALSGGVTNGFNTITNQGVAYDPSSDSWTALPNAQFPRYRAAGSCGFYKVGGSTGGFSPTRESERLSELEQCGVTDVPWLAAAPTTATLQPGESVTVTVTTSATAEAGVTQPGTYAAQLSVRNNTPYRVDPIDVRMNVVPPKGWGKIAGAVTGTDCKNNTAPLRNVQVQANGKTHTFSLKTDANGRYALWAPAGSNPFTVIASKDGYTSQVKTNVNIKANKTVTADFALRQVGC